MNYVFEEYLRKFVTMFFFWHLSIAKTLPDMQSKYKLRNIIFKFTYLFFSYKYLNVVAKEFYVGVHSLT